MPTIRFGDIAKCLTLAASGLLTIALATGCTTASIAPATIKPEPEVHTPPMPDGWIPVARYGRYTLAELSPGAAQRHLMLQIVDINIPNTLHATVGDALRHVLLRSGYQLCQESDSTTLHHLPLPAAHYHLGPMALRDALVTLAGIECSRAWL